MRLTDHTDYSFRVLMYLNQKKQPATLNELSEKLDVSKNNLIKVSNQLAKLGYITTTRGRTGGLVINEDTGSRTLKEILLETEESFHLAGCFKSNRCDCSFVKNCLLKQSLKKALDSFLNSLAEKTLNDITL
ncbi:MAG: Rrf2 family transcriptional regulator [Bdellovibrionaceae bacterium]|nr:Rrf2 family transcriptional regulator [Pseudobdellovibrionaceae bacterium]